MVTSIYAIVTGVADLTIIAMTIIQRQLGSLQEIIVTQLTKMVTSIRAIVTVMADLTIIAMTIIQRQMGS